jgi:predicted metal-dependent hydrolase
VDAVSRGVSLFNRGLYWEAHEAWEELWLELEDEPKLFLQGLIQLAAAYHKATVQMQPSGCVKLHRSALGKLERAPPDFMGVRTAPLLAAARRTLAEAEKWLAGESAGIDRALLPRIDLL